MGDIRLMMRQNKTLLQNFSFLSVLQLFNVLVPILTYPYLIRVLGKEPYGLVVYAQVLVSYLLVLVNFGFETSATREVSIHRENKEKLSEIFSSVFIIKGLFFIVSLFLLGLLIFFLPLAREHQALFWLSMWICLCDVLFPVWFFQGLEKMKYITILNVVSRSIFILLIFFVVKNPGDYLMVPLINGIGGVIAGVLALYVCFKNEQIRFVFPPVKTIYVYFKNSINYFISNLSGKIFIFSNKLIIGTFLGMTPLAYYDLADKIIALFRNIPMDIVRNTIYPRVAKTKNMEVVRKTTVIMTVFAVLSVIFINLFAPEIVFLFGGKEMLPSLNIVRLFSLIIILDHLQHYYLTVGLWSLGYSWLFRNMMVMALGLYFFCYLILWALGWVNVYSVTAVPMLIDVYLIVHVSLFWTKHHLSSPKRNENPSSIRYV